MWSFGSFAPECEGCGRFGPGIFGLRSKQGDNLRFDAEPPTRIPRYTLHFKPETPTLNLQPRSCCFGGVFLGRGKKEGLVDSWSSRSASGAGGPSVTFSTSEEVGSRDKKLQLICGSFLILHGIPVAIPSGVLMNLAKP